MFSWYSPAYWHAKTVVVSLNILAILLLIMSDDDIGKHCRKLYAQDNTLVRKFHMCSTEVKITLFRTYYTAMYTVYLWCNYRMHSMRKLTVAYNDYMRILLRIPHFFKRYTNVCKYTSACKSNTPENFNIQIYM